MEKPGQRLQKQPVRLKICGLRRPEDVDYVNEAAPDFCGFIIDIPKSQRSISPETARELRRRLRPGIVAVGVVADTDLEKAAGLLLEGAVDAVQLHGREDEAYIDGLRNLLLRKGFPLRDRPWPVLIKAFSIRSREDLVPVAGSGADMVLLDNGAGGTGRSFDWSLLKGEDGAERPYILAGGLRPDNLQEAMEALRPWGLDISSGVETEGKKDRDKILAATAAVRRWNQR